MTDESRDARKGASRAPAGSKTPVSGAEFAGIGVQFAAAILVFALAGTWLDKRLGSEPWLLVIGVFAGATAGFYSMYRKVTAAQRRERTGAHER